MRTWNVFSFNSQIKCFRRPVSSESAGRPCIAIYWTCNISLLALCIEMTWSQRIKKHCSHRFKRKMFEWCHFLVKTRRTRKKNHGLTRLQTRFRLVCEWRLGLVVIYLRLCLELFLLTRGLIWLFNWLTCFWLAGKDFILVLMDSRQLG